jgi:Protein of unknown function (DUF664)
MPWSGSWTVSEYDIRRPMVPTGTNLLGLLKHVASIELGYLGTTFGRPSDEPLPWFEDDAEPNADMWATADVARSDRGAVSPSTPSVGCRGGRTSGAR